ncbi:MAG: mycoredoxin [Actinomycetota bacterium]|nr:mycoredoxin [Actinomycetota bacterium]MEA2487728.1 mycoredoxin [Actinomycetota bacterium]
MSTAVTIYSTTWCGHCRRLKRQLDDIGVPYSEVDIEDSVESARRIEAATGGYRTVPTVEVGERMLINPSVIEVRDAVGAAS